MKMKSSRNHKSTYLLGERLAKVSASPDLEKEWQMHVADSPSSFCESLKGKSPDGLSGKMSPVSCRLKRDKHLVPSSGHWLNSGMGSDTESLTLKTSESRKDAVVSSLSGILETGDLPRRLYLKKNVCSRI